MIAKTRRPAAGRPDPGAGQRRDEQDRAVIRVGESAGGVRVS